MLLETARALRYLHDDVLQRLNAMQTFEQIVADAVSFEIKGSVRVYHFDGFGLMVPA